MMFNFDPDLRIVYSTSYVRAISGPSALEHLKRIVVGDDALRPHVYVKYKYDN